MFFKIFTSLSDLGIIAPELKDAKAFAEEHSGADERIDIIGSRGIRASRIDGIWRTSFLHWRRPEPRRWDSDTLPTGMTYLRSNNHNPPI